MAQIRFVLTLFCLLFFLEACAYSIYEDKRLIGTIKEDATLATSIKTALMKEDLGSAFSVSVYCFYGHVFLVGEASQNAQAKALQIARSFHPLSVTPHWFAPSKSERSGMALAADLRSKLIGAKGLSSTRIDVEVNAGRVVLLGVVHDDAEKQQAIKIARGVKGVTSVTSYLMLPQKPAHP